jgi:DNA-binding MarR family transcriptional regulator
MDPARVSRAQQRLIDLRLATGTTDPKDRRRVVLELTARGREIVSRMVPEALRIEERLMGSLDTSERKALAAIMGKLYRETREIESGGGQ